MAVNQQTIDDAEWTFCYDVVPVRATALPSRAAPGNFQSGQQITELPWAFLRFGDVGEERKYVVPTNGVTFSGFSSSGMDACRYEFQEYMPFQPFPVDTARPARSSGPDDTRFGGPVSVHFFGWV